MTDSEKPIRRLRLLVIAGAYVFPSEGRPNAGIFFANLLRRLLPLTDRLAVVVPTAYVPAPLAMLPRFAAQARASPHAFWHDIEVFRPRYLSLRAATHNWFQSRSACLAAAPLCETLHRRHDFDLVLGNGLVAPAHIAQCVGARIGRPSVAWAIGSDVHTYPHWSEENLRLLRHNVRHCHMVLTTSEALRRDLLAACPGAGHVHTFYRGIDLACLDAPADRATSRAALGMAADQIYMLTAGDVHKAKGSEEFYVVFRRLASRRPNLAGLWVGSGMEEAGLRERAARDGLANRFTLTGHVPRSKVLDFMRAADLMLFPSHVEGLPNVVMEAMAAGLPVAASDVGGVGEIIADGVTGLCVPSGNVDAMAVAVERFLDQPVWAAAVAARGQQLIREHFDVSRNAPVLLEILEHVAAGKPADGPLSPGEGGQRFRPSTD